MTIKEALTWGSSELVEVCERPQYEAELLLAYALKKDRTYLIVHDNDHVDIKEYEKLIARRKKSEPYEYIVGEASFYDIYLKVEEGVLIPRPETEILIDFVADIIQRESITSIAEIGVGSGAISVVLARKFPDLKIVATDISQKAIDIASKNIERFDLADRVKVIKSNLLDDIKENIELVVSNPPYIANDFKLEPNVKEYEPPQALFGGEVGDELLKKIVLDVKARGVRYLACEMGYDQKEPMEIFFRDNEIEDYSFYKDLAGFDRGFLVAFDNSFLRYLPV